MTFQLNNQEALIPAKIQINIPKVNLEDLDIV